MSARPVRVRHSFRRCRRRGRQDRDRCRPAPRDRINKLEHQRYEIFETSVRNCWWWRLTPSDWWR